jgi:hypothetical protein
MSSCNAINRTTTIVVLLCLAYAGNINNKLFSLSVGITATIELSSATIAATVFFCMLRNLAVLSIIYYN